jgi:hypothetical protein
MVKALEVGELLLVVVKRNKKDELAGISEVTKYVNSAPFVVGVPIDEQGPESQIDETVSVSNSLGKSMINE